MYHYTAYALNIESELPLPSLLPGTGKADVTIRVDNPIPGQKSENGYKFPDRQTACLYWDQVGRIVVRAGQEMVVSPCLDGDPAVLGLCVITAGLNMLLHQRGLFLLHASAIDVADTCMAFMGRSGSGKSTLAAYLQQQGFQLIADDIAVIESPTADQVTVRHSFPQIKLKPDVVEALNGIPAANQQAIKSYDKYIYALPAIHYSADLPLQAIFLLEFADTLAVERLISLEAFKVLLANSYAGNMILTRHIDLLQITGRQQDYFRECSRLAASVPVFRLKRPQQLSDLPRTYALIKTTLDL